MGNLPGCDLVAGDGPQEAELLAILGDGESYQIRPGAGTTGFSLDGQDGSFAEIRNCDEHALVVNGRPFAIKMGADAKEWVEALDPGRWFVYRRDTQQWTGPVPARELPRLAQENPDQTIFSCQGMNTIGFYPSQMLRRLAAAAAVSPVSATAAPNDENFEIPEINAEYGEFTCPVCWFRFDRGDVLSIAVHASLRGDPVLGEEHMRRFSANRFNDRNQALDAMGMVAPELACPHCRRKLPPGFLDQAHHIFSIVGAPSSGKSYYLSVLVKSLQEICFRHFGLAFRDAAPADNAVLNDMRNHLFSAGSPEDAYLAKTDLEGALYESLPRQGRLVKLPKPFVFRLSDRSGDGFSIVFYDNAGEHFEPGRNSADSPGAQHIAVASGIFFLFDPLYNPAFRRKLTGHADPQLAQHRNDQQDILLAESETRIKEILGLPSNERVATPLAVIAGKSDAWLTLLGPEPLLPAVESSPEGALIRLDHLQANSQRVRALLLEICPSIVANAEAISSVVMYFAASPLGHAPVEFIDGSGVRRIGPEPARLDPQRVEDATLWVLSNIAPTRFPSHS